MDIKELEYADFALQSLIKNRPIENFIFYDALNGISDFLKSQMTGDKRNLVNKNIDTFYGIKNILEIYYKGGSCLREIIEVNYLDFRNLVNQLNS